MLGQEYECRRDALGSHVKSKHVAEIKKMLLAEYVSREGDKTHTTLQKIMNGKNPPIYSELYENAEYIFGVKPAIFMDEEYKQQMAYNASQMNMDAHAVFLREITNAITLTEMMEANVEIIVRSPEVVELKRKLASNEKMVVTLQEDAEKNQTYMSSLKQDIQDFKDLGDIQQSVAALRKELDFWRHSSHRANKELEGLKVTFKHYQETTEKTYHDTMESRLQMNHATESMMMETTEKCRDLESKIKQKIADGIAKELDKMRKEKEKEKEKAKKEKRRAKEKLKEAQMMAKLKAKMKKKADASSSDSDSDSDSDASLSDSDDE